MFLQLVSKVFNEVEGDTFVEHVLISLILIRVRRFLELNLVAKVNEMQ